MEAEFLIVGQGLAGTCLAHQLLAKGKTVKIIENGKLPSSSKVAGGMFNPVTGKRLALTWKQEELFAYLDEFYSKKEKLLNSHFLYKMQLYRPYKNENQKHQFDRGIDHKELRHLLKPVTGLPELDGVIHNPLGGMLTYESGRLDVPRFIEKSAEYFKKTESYIEDFFEYSNLSIESQYINYKGNIFKNVIFCEGIHVRNNSLFNWLPFNPVKGETLDVTLKDAKLEIIINQGSWVMPMGNGGYKMGSTYDWGQLDFETTEEAKKTILEKSRNYLIPEIKVVSQTAGIRPAVVDRRPILGSHPKNKNVFIFNGLGTKGVSLAPYFSLQLAEHLIEGKEIDIESTIERFYPLYS